jgi:hypothetical protein
MTGFQLLRLHVALTLLPRQLAAALQVRIEDESVTPEDIQCAVHMALFNSERARSKRLRQDEFLGNA